MVSSEKLYGDEISREMSPEEAEATIKRGIFEPNDFESWQLRPIVPEEKSTL